MAFSVVEWKKQEVAFVGIVLALVVGVSGLQLVIGQMKARDAQRRADTELVGRALQAYFVEHDEYPAAVEGKIAACGGKNMQGCDWGGENLGDAQGQVYLRQIPQDPKTYAGWKYVYEVNSTRQKYRIYAALEYSGDPSFKPDLTVRCSATVQCSWYAGNY